MSTPFHPAAYALQGIINLSNEVERELARLLGINLTDYRALSTLSSMSAFGLVTIGGLAEKLGSLPATTTAIVKRLEAQGYVQRRPCVDGDRRQVEIRPTDLALRRITHLMEPLTAATSEHICLLTDKQQQDVIEFFAIAENQMRDHLSALASMNEAL